MGAYLCSLRNRVTEDFDLDVTKGRVEGNGHDCGRAASWSKRTDDVVFDSRSLALRTLVAA
jgi:predicted PP-loop superfamily ATPase